MAEEEEVIILEDEGEKPSEPLEEAEEGEAPPPRKDKKLLLLLGGAALLLLLAAGLLVAILVKRQQAPEAAIDTEKIAEKIKSSEKLKPLATPSEIERMIKKANLLYERGNKKEALGLFEQIAAYSASISYYNLGVAQMRQERYEEAIESFKKAIQNGENRAISAINAAACALHLKDRKRFEYYLQMAEANLPDSYNSSLYSYLYALVNYYKGNYFEILSAVNHPTSQTYNKELDHIGAVSYAVFERPEKAVGLLERRTAPTDYLVLGQLYARTGDFPMAVRYLQKAIEEGEDPVKSRKALALVYLKDLMPQKSADLLKKLAADFNDKGKDLYPIGVRLAPAVYDIHAAQKRYAADEMVTPPNAFRLLFEFAPFKVFNASQTINYIKKGNASIYVDEAPEAAKYLSRSSSISRVNILISKAIKAAIDHRLRRANALLQEALKKYPNHSILHYNLGLTYAQLGNFTKAHKHFLRSYHLDTTNYLSAIFALMCETLTGEPIPQVEQFVSDDLGQIENPTVADRFHRALFYFYKGNIAGASKWPESGHDNRPIYLLLDLLVYANEGMWEQAQKSATKLRDRMPRDVLANLLYLQMHERHQPIKRFSAAAQRYLKEHPFDLDAVYYGSAFTRENYIALRFITGTLYRLKERLEAKLIEEQQDPAGIIEALALTDIFLRKYEEAYVLLNQLVDQYHMQDSRTLFLTAVAAIGAGHHANATALLELAKLTDPGNLESRYALGLLHLEEGNTDAAVIQFSKIPNGTFRSEFFDFDVVGYLRGETADIVGSK
ncbi:tetratricopeptide repeat protein [Hydrogenimonas sp.]